MVGCRMTSPPVGPNHQIIGVDLKIKLKYQELGSVSLQFVPVDTPVVHRL